MLSIYITSVLFGGVLLAASVLGGHDGPGGADGGGSGDAHGGDDHHATGKLPFLSLRFWAFATAFFGLAGGALTLATGMAAAATAAIAGAVGVGCGVVSARVIRQLGAQSVGLIGGAQAHLGREGRVLLPVAPGQRGKIRLTIAGVSTDLVAETEGGGRLEPGEPALVVGLRENVALVEAVPGALPATRKSTPAALPGLGDAEQEKS